MSWIIVKRNNDLWNVWSTNTDTYVFENDLILEDVKQLLIEEEQKRVEERIIQKFNYISQGNKLHFKTEAEISENYCTED